MVGKIQTVASEEPWGGKLQDPQENESSRVSQKTMVLGDLLKPPQEEKIFLNIKANTTSDAVYNETLKNNCNNQRFLLVGVNKSMRSLWSKNWIPAFDRSKN